MCESWSVNCKLWAKLGFPMPPTTAKHCSQVPGESTNSRNLGIQLSKDANPRAGELAAFAALAQDPG